jgi:hypothetical protein
VQQSRCGGGSVVGGGGGGGVVAFPTFVFAVLHGQAQVFLQQSLVQCVRRCGVKADLGRPGKAMGKQWESNSKIVKQWESNGTAMGQQWESNGKAMGKQ